MNKKIALIYMGGTFGCIGEPLAPMSEHEFIPQLKRILPPQLKIECFKAASIKDSSACTALDWLMLVQQIQSLQRQSFEHFVVIHGTDTLSYAAATLSRFLAQSCHVIITGSQYPLLNLQGNDTREFTDAIDNLNTALDAVTKLPVGVYLAFFHQVIHAQTALKTHSTALDAFRGLKAEEPIHQDSSILQIQPSHIEKAGLLNIVNWMMVPTELLQFKNNLNTLAQHPPHFLIIQAYGVGNLAVDTGIIQSFKNLQTKGCQIILSTQVPLGGMDQRYAISQWIQDSKILVSDALSQADLYAKILKIYLQYPTSQQWHNHWYDHPE
ncbi:MULTISPECIES: asparaginase domain-containing protein [unclassified Acinetobacter]|uniref:asparaginase domain-containing protein n=1 Tax=unclassified Acinetobacter TaxID=196816 RepID=UPI0018A968C4|nr:MULTISPECIES: asparaginase domain-containing protein [unclassified Acinetobacter]MBJ9952380.1 asparaginase [Acinetobacter baumannii]